MSGDRGPHPSIRYIYKQQKSRDTNRDKGEKFENFQIFDVCATISGIWNSGFENNNCLVVNLGLGKS